MEEKRERERERERERDRERERKEREIPTACSCALCTGGVKYLPVHCFGPEMCVASSRRFWLAVFM